MKQYELSNGQILVIREARQEDASGIIDYVNQVGRETDYLTFGEGEFGITVDMEKDFIAGVSQSDNRLMICAFLEDKLVGQLVFNGGHRPRIKHTGEFGITVLQEYWGAGIGRELLNYLLEWAQGKQIIRKINLKVRSDNQRAISLYRRLGFVPEGTITREFLINGIFYDCLHMGLEIN